MESRAGSASIAIWPRPVIVPVPNMTAGVESPVVSLNGTWKFNPRPASDFWRDETDPNSWTDIDVPGEWAMQGFNLPMDAEYAYKKQVVVPRDFQGKRVILRFDGVYSYARVWVNGSFVRDHTGGFTSWDCDLTDRVTPGKTAWITLGVTDRSDDISWGSEYAKHSIGGVLGGVRLFAVPSTYATRFHVETDLDESYAQARVKVSMTFRMEKESLAAVSFSLWDPSGTQVPIAPASAELKADAPEVLLTIPISSPQKWDAEHPRLYRFEARVTTGGTVQEALSRSVGFRKIEKRGNRILVNGLEVKLRGGCRHNAHPLRGRSTTPELDEQDVLLFRDANVNFIRTSHYPPSEKFLEACDRYGMYVEEESAVCFVGTHGNLPTQDNPEYAARYANQFAEMLERDRSHPSILMWSLGNESKWGTNLERTYQYARLEDDTRPVIFSYPAYVPPGTGAYEVLSSHYPKYDSDFSSAAVPRLNDEFAHVACYNLETLRRDPGVRDFWGESLKRFWEKMFVSEGCLGGAIWGLIDEVFLKPDGTCGYGEWGIIDGWRRPKPEYWHVKKAYSPIRLRDEPLGDPGKGNTLQIPVKNWFDHTNLREVEVTWTAGKDSGKINGPDVPPHGEGLILLPARDWQSGDAVHLEFWRPGRILVDEYNLPVGVPVRSFPPARGPAPRISEDRLSISISGADYRIVFSKETGLISAGEYRGQKILEGGPWIEFGAAAPVPWSLTSIDHTADGMHAIIRICGSYAGTLARFVVRIDAAGLIITECTLNNVPADRAEVGISYVLAPEIDLLNWDRKGLWSAYPADHIGRNAGTAHKSPRVDLQEFRVRPEWPWSEDTRDYFLFGKNDAGWRGTTDFRSLKGNIFFASAVVSGTGSRVRVESDATDAVRAEVEPDGRVRLNIIDKWGYPGLGWGNYEESPGLPDTYTFVVRMRLTDNDAYDRGHTLQAP